MVLARTSSLEGAETGLGRRASAAWQRGLLLGARLGDPGRPSDPIDLRALIVFSWGRRGVFSHAC